MKYETVVIGGGLAGLVAGIELARAGREVVLIERRDYPHHKVCGEYVSNEVKPYLLSLGLDLDRIGAADIRRFAFTSPKGSVLGTSLNLGGFGVSRYTLDHELYQLATAAGVLFRLHTVVEGVEWRDGRFRIGIMQNQPLEAEMVIGAFGKRTRLDKQLNRAFMNRPSPYLGVKYHIAGDFPKDLISLHNFENGYCGMSAIENDRYCLCYLTERSNLKKAGSLAEMERTILARNPHLKEIFSTAHFLYDKPEVINEISFAPKKAVENHILMAGDSAGLITPLCGNGMAMAVRAGVMAARLVERYFSSSAGRPETEANYQRAWNREFATRLRVGRGVQRLFGREVLSEMALHFFRWSPVLLEKVIEATHGEEFT